MPLLKHKNHPPEHPPEQTPVEHPPEARDDTPKRKGSLFSWRRHSSSSDDMRMNPSSTNHDAGKHSTHDTHNYDGHSHKRGGIFSHRQASSSSDETSRGSNRFGGKTHRLNDPSIIAARQKVSEAEEAERHADQALVEARASVRAAREHVKNLEHEIEEESRLHKLKEKEAKQVRKSIKGLGRYD